jgi:hypothetical protein
MMMIVPIPFAYIKKVSRNQNRSRNLEISLIALKKRLNPTVTTFSPISLVSTMRTGSLTRRKMGIEKTAHQTATLARLRRIISMVACSSPKLGSREGPSEDHDHIDQQ